MFLSRTRSVVSALALLACIAACAACGSSARTKALHATYATLKATSTAFVAWDAQTQDGIVEKATSLEEGQAALVKHRHDREPVVFGFLAAYEALTAAYQNNTPERFAAALKAAAQVYKLLERVAPGLLPTDLKKVIP